MEILTQHFKIYPGGWEHPISPDNLLSAISFVFTMKGYKGLYFKLKEPIPDLYNVGMDCFEFEFDADNGMYIKDGDMRFNDFMGKQITDSGADVVVFIKTYLINIGLDRLIKN